MTGIEFLIVLAITLAISAAAAGLSYALAPKSDIEGPEAAGLGDFGFPTNLESRYIPVVWGSTRIDGQNVIWYGDFSARELDTGGQTVGWEYSLGMDLALCWGPIDTLSEITIDDEYALKPGENYALWNTLTNSTEYAPVYGYSATQIGERLLSFKDTQFFGGSKRGGRLIGDLRFYYGTANQLANSYISDQEKNNYLEVSAGVQISKGQLVPRYPELCHAVWEGGVLSESAVLNQWKFTVHRYPTAPASSFAKVAEDPSNGYADANPANVIYEILTDTNWGLSIPAELIDTNSFVSAAEQCYNAGNGFSYTMDNPKQAKSVIDDICSQINGMLVQNANGLFQLKLLRKTYRTSDNAVLDYEGNVVSGQTIRSIDESSIIEIKSASRQSWEETFNVVQAKYYDRRDEFKETVATAHDLGNMAIQNGKRRVKKVDLPGVRTSEAAAIVAQRNLQSLAYPITSVDIEVSREFSDMRPGDVIEINHPDFGLYDFYMRVLEVGLPKDTDGNVLLKGVRDVFDEPTAADLMHVGGDTTSSSMGDVAPIEATVVDMSGLTHFHHQQLVPGSTGFHTWHIVGAPTATSRAAQAFQADALAAGIWNDTSDLKQLPPVGRVIAHSSDIWRDRQYARRYLNDSAELTNKKSGPYGNNPGPRNNPVYGNTNVKTTMVDGFMEDAITVYDLNADSMGRYGSLWVDGLGDPDALVQTLNEDQIQYHGYGLAMVRPKWANGDPRFDEIIAYKSAYVLRIELLEWILQSKKVKGIFINNNYPAYFSTPWFGQEPTIIEGYRVLVLDQIYRGVMDTGIQTLNTGSDIIFLSSGDILHDRVGAAKADLQAGGTWLTSGNETYRHQISAVGGRTDLDQGTDRTALAEQRYRRNLPAPPVMMTQVPQPGTTTGDNNDFWGRCYYDNGEWQGYYFPSNGTSPTSSRFEMRWLPQNVIDAVTPKVWFYDETSAFSGSATNFQTYFTFNLLEDDTSASTTVGVAGQTAEQLRKRHAMARYKEGWMPTNPPLSYPDTLLDTPTATEQPFVASFTKHVSNNGQNSNTGDDLVATFEAAPHNAQLTVGQKYYVEIWIQSALADGSAPLELSHGAQRVIFEFER